VASAHCAKKGSVSLQTGCRVTSRLDADWFPPVVGPMDPDCNRHKRAPGDAAAANPAIMAQTPQHNNRTVGRFKWGAPESASRFVWQCGAAIFRAS
jgi:hypothetical protein